MEKKDIVQRDEFKRTDSDKASQLGPNSPTENTTKHPQDEGFRSSADNDMDRQGLFQDEGNLEKDADEAQSDGNIGFPPGK